MPTRRAPNLMTKLNIKSDPELVRRLQAAAGRTLSGAEVRAQRVSFVYGNMPQDSSVSRAEIAAIIAKIEGDEATAA